MVKKTISAQESAEQVREKEELRARAARQSADKRRAAAAGAEAEEQVNVRVTKLGADKVSMGVHASGIGDAYFEHAEETTLPVSVAKILEERGFVEITAAKVPAKDDGEDGKGEASE